jgi:hypothetical protein
MSAIHPPASDMLVTVKSREVQRALLAEMRDDPAAARRHFLAAAHLELVLAEDHRAGGDLVLAARSRLSAASCFWRAGDLKRAEEVFNDLLQSDPSQGRAVAEARAELARDHPPA